MDENDIIYEKELLNALNEMRIELDQILWQKNEIEQQLCKEKDWSQHILQELTQQNTELTQKYNQLLQDFDSINQKLKDQQTQHLKELEQQSQELCRQLNAETQHHNANLQQQQELKQQVEELKKLNERLLSENASLKSLSQQQSHDGKNTTSDIVNKYNDLLRKFDALQSQQQQFADQRLGEAADQSKQLIQKLSKQLEEQNLLLKIETQHRAEIEELHRQLKGDVFLLKAKLVETETQLSESRVKQSSVQDDVRQEQNSIQFSEKKLDSEYAEEISWLNQQIKERGEVNELLEKDKLGLRKQVGRLVRYAAKCKRTAQACIVISVLSIATTAFSFMK